MKDKIIDLLNREGPMSYFNILNTLECENDELARVVYEMEDVDIIKEGKLYYLIDGTKFIRGTVVIRNDNPFLKTLDESIYISKKNLGNAFDKDIVIATVVYDYLGRKEAKIYKVVNITLS